MKNFLFALLAMACATAFAGEIKLPAPLVFDYYTNVNCHYNPPAFTAANGFTTDGNYLTGVSEGYVACGHSGRGSNIVYTRYCLIDTWDLTGNLVSVVEQPYASCPRKQYDVEFTDPVNPAYQAYTVTNSYYGYIQSQYAVLVTP